MRADGVPTAVGEAEPVDAASVASEGGASWAEDDHSGLLARAADAFWGALFPRPGADDSDSEW